MASRDGLPSWHGALEVHAQCGGAQPQLPHPTLCSPAHQPAHTQPASTFWPLHITPVTVTSKLVCGRVLCPWEI